MTLSEIVHAVAQRHLGVDQGETEIFSFPPFAPREPPRASETDAEDSANDNRDAEEVDELVAADGTQGSAGLVSIAHQPTGPISEPADTIPAAALVEKAAAVTQASEPLATDPASGRREPAGEAQASLPHRQLHRHVVAAQRRETRDVTRGLTSPARRVETGVRADSPDAGLAFLTPDIVGAVEQRHQPTSLYETPAQTSPEPGDHLLKVGSTIEEGSRRMMQSLSDVESSLARLFQTQIETLQRLRERALEQERRWVDFAAVRRG